MPIDINAIIAETRGKNFELYEEHVNPVFVKVLRTLGFNRTWVRGEGPYLWDEAGTRYLDFLTNWGVFNFGRRHPAIRGGIAAGAGLRFSRMDRFRRPAPCGRAGS